ncbi:MAG: hypothetical protein QOI71_1208 [Gaiellales bacterium]|jgi:hypothetical protein|nr:hypothetical protein [Gaiellales bacterium]
MPNRKIEKRRRKLRVHGPSTDAVGAPPTGRKQPRASATAPPARGQRGRREPPVPSLKRSARKSSLLAVFMVAIVVVTMKNHNAASIAFAAAEVVAVIIIFTFFDLWLARKVYKRVTGNEAPR